MKTSGIAPFNRLQFIATVAVTATITASLAWYWSGRDVVRRTLVDAAGSLDHRVVEARIHGFPYRPLRTRRGSISAASNLALMNAAATVVRAEDAIDDVQRAHLAAVAELLRSDWDVAAQTMDEALRIETGEQTIAAAIRVSADVVLLTDLAAAHHSLARYRNRPRHYVIAAEAANRAWSLERTQETAWNRALTIEALSMRDAAIAAWGDYLALDDDSAWASEAREHLAAVKAPTAAAQWKDARTLLERAVARGDQKAVAQIVGRFPDHARIDAEGEYLLRWARGGGDQALAICRAIGKALRASTGEALLFDTVAHIDASHESRRTALMHALVSYGEASAARNKGYELAVAGPLFRRALDELQRAGSPFAEVARLFLWQCDRYEDNGEVIDATARWLASAPRQYPALLAQVHWTRGISLMRAGQPQAALEEYSRALELFTRLGEMDQVTAMHEMISEAYADLGDSEEAWKHLFAALERFGTSGTSHPTLLDILRLSAEAALQDGFPAVAVLFLDRQLAATSAAPYDTQFSPLLWRSNAHSALGDVRTATADLRRARAVAERIKDPSVRTEAFNQLEMVLDRLSQEPDHDARQRILNEAIAYATQKKLTYRLSYLYLRQGIEHRDRKRFDEAERSLFASADQLEKQRDEIAEDEQRGTFLAARQDVYRVLASVLCKRGDYGRAVEVIERSRARTLFEHVSQRSGSTPQLLSYRQIQAALPTDTALVVLGDVGGHFGSFVVSRHDVAYGKILTARSDLAQRIERFRTALRDNDQKEAILASQVLHAAIVRPWYPHARQFDRLIIVADDPFAAIPFAALNDRVTGKFLIERHVISAAPSANVLFAGAANRAAAASTVSALIVAPSTSAASAGNEVLLAASRAEATEVARQYASPVVLEGAQATLDEFLARAAKASYIHFAGHAIAEDTAIPHLLFAAGRRLYAEDIRALRLPATRLVVLAACDSGSDRTRHTQGISSLARAFLAAGVPTVVASYWDVDDVAASRLSRRLHTFLGRGYDPADALRNAQLQSLTSPDARSRNVSSWAPFVVIGQPTTR